MSFVLFVGLLYSFVIYESNNIMEPLLYIILIPTIIYTILSLREWKDTLVKLSKIRIKCGRRVSIDLKPIPFILDVICIICWIIIIACCVIN